MLRLDAQSRRALAEDFIAAQVRFAMDADNRAEADDTM